MDRKPKSFWKSIFPRLGRRHRSEDSPLSRQSRHLQIGGPTSRSDNSILYNLNRRALFSQFSASRQDRLRHWQPKCLPDIVYEDILNGQVEDSSSSCWLEDHLHRFASMQHQHQHTDFSGGHRELRHLFDVYNSDCDSLEEEEEQLSSEGDGSFSRDAVVEPVPAFARQVVESLTYQAEMGLTLEEQPPPYYEDPPPSYEEATRVTNHSNTTPPGFIVNARSDILY